ncbi:hypothetical protein FH972_011520 [Carpinus fangiana]|uniref:Uncharacterized protein n=1 Tax=Carpinus fangiana TaxID=176857 RepID=A0A660KRK1_9ROSI|nr:hypothetical protein FH972_011520 [Carpinus fangiana]
MPVWPLVLKWFGWKTAGPTLTTEISDPDPVLCGWLIKEEKNGEALSLQSTSKQHTPNESPNNENRPPLCGGWAPKSTTTKLKNKPYTSSCHTRKINSNFFPIRLNSNPNLNKV